MYICKGLSTVRRQSCTEVIMNKTKCIAQISQVISVTAGSNQRLVCLERSMYLTY